ncbi:hypothetical protein ACH427_15850 [Streptomyces sp. NPDC020379]|uniref:hypothetical protein n=1 Tax=Streptomyces sp. NPDC020379 TaxID=3365071 RepID=UPI0037B5B071
MKALVRVRADDVPGGPGEPSVALAHVNGEFAAAVTEGLGLPAPQPETGITEVICPALSQENLRGDGIRTRKVTVLAADGSDAAQVPSVREWLTDAGAVVETLAATHGEVRGSGGPPVKVDRALPGAHTAPRTVPGGHSPACHGPR